ncbi:MAG: phosphatidylglycerophosphatase A [Gammaproteobacteria bacterium]
MMMNQQQSTPKLKSLESNITIQDLRQDFRLLCAFGFGSGLAKKMPGTCGTLAALPVAVLLSFLPYMIHGAVIVVAFFIGIYLCGRAARQLGVPDHPGIVWDEFVGYWITVYLIPNHWYWYLLGFGLFRLFDVVKPWPISWFDKNIEGGFGIMLDDVFAGIYGWVFLHVLVWFAPH